jgi:DNA modification methylase
VAKTLGDKIMPAQSKIYDFYNKDARELLQVIPPNTVDVAITSPPYFRRKRYTTSKAEIGRERSIDTYLKNLKDIFQKCRDVTKDTGSLWIVADAYREKGEFIPLPSMIAEKVKECRWKLRDVIIWDKVKTRPWSANGQYKYLRRIFEYILFFTKTDKFKFFINNVKEPDPSLLKPWWVDYPERYNPQGRTPTNLWSFTIPAQGSWGRRYLRHFCPFPPELIERIIKLTTEKGDVVLDPFAGSGVVLAQAHHMGRKYIGFEINPDYAKMFERVLVETKGEAKRIEKDQADLRKIGRIFRRTITQLRLVKYPKAVLRKAHNTFPDEVSLNTVFVTPNCHEKANLMRENIYLVLNSEKNKEAFLNHIQEICSKPPLSLFGIKARLYLLTHSEFTKKRIAFPKKLWLYAKGAVRAPIDSITLKEWKLRSDTEDWIKMSLNGIPPIISNIDTRKGLSSLFKHVKEHQPELLIKDKFPKIMPNMLQ